MNNTYFEVLYQKTNLPKDLCIIISEYSEYITINTKKDILHFMSEEAFNISKTFNDSADKSITLTDIGDFPNNIKSIYFYGVNDDGHRLETYYIGKLNNNLYFLV